MPACWDCCLQELLLIHFPDDPDVTARDLYSRLQSIAGKQADTVIVVSCFRREYRSGA